MPEGSPSQQCFSCTSMLAYSRARFAFTPGRRVSHKRRRRLITGGGHFMRLDRRKMYRIMTP